MSERAIKVCVNIFVLAMAATPLAAFGLVIYFDNWNWLYLAVPGVIFFMAG